MITVDTKIPQMTTDISSLRDFAAICRIVNGFADFFDFKIIEKSITFCRERRIVFVVYFT